jgi:Coenzyme PQQ synthesis protein D (PqqD)
VQTATGHSSHGLGVPSTDPQTPDKWQMKFARNPDISWTTLDGETILLNLENGFYYTLNRVSSVIWEQLSGAPSLDDILATLHARFDVDEAVIREDLNALIDQLCHEGLIAEEER